MNNRSHSKLYWYKYWLQKLMFVLFEMLCLNSAVCGFEYTRHAPCTNLFMPALLILSHILCYSLANTYICLGLMESVCCEHNTTTSIVLLADEHCGSQNIPVKGRMVAIVGLTGDLHPLLCVCSFPTVPWEERKPFRQRDVLLRVYPFQMCVPWGC